MFFNGTRRHCLKGTRKDHLFSGNILGLNHCLLLNKSLIKYVKRESVSHSVGSDSLRPYGLSSVRPLCPWNSLGKYTAVGCHALPQKIFPSQGLNLGLLNCRQILYRLSHLGSPIKFVVTYKFEPSKNAIGFCQVEKITPMQICLWDISQAHI